jgi:hypothetical protein
MSLAARSTTQERMDTDCSDSDDYRHCLRDLARVNTVTLTHRPMPGWLAREAAGLRSSSLLDVACGHGDALRRIHRWAERRGIAARLDGVDSAGDAGSACCDRRGRIDHLSHRRRVRHRSDRDLRLHCQLAVHTSSLRWPGGDVHPVDGGAREARVVHWRCPDR